jgi:hypothetical protein
VRAEDHLLLDVTLALPRHDESIPQNFLIAPFLFVPYFSSVDTAI